MMRNFSLRWAGVLLLLLLLHSLLLIPSAAIYAQTPDPTAVPVEAMIVVTQAPVFPLPDRNAAPLTYLYERERVPVLGQSPDGVFLLVIVGDQQGWILLAQVEVSGDLTAVPIVADACLRRQPQRLSGPPTPACWRPERRCPRGRLRDPADRRRSQLPDR